MATRGSPWKVEKTAIIASIKKNMGVLTRCAKEFNVNPETFRNKVNSDPELVELLQSERNSFETTMLDMAEGNLMYAMGLQKSDINAALKSTFYVLNNKGRERGYQRIKGDEDGSENPVEALKKYIREFSRSPESEGSKLEDKSSLLDQGQTGE